jgi:hypothetical protein
MIALKLKNLANAIDVVKYFNAISFEDFYKAVEEYNGEKFDKEIIEKWKFTGLMNKDFFQMYAKEDKQ